MHKKGITRFSSRGKTTQRLRHTTTWLIVMWLCLGGVVALTTPAGAEPQPIPTGYTQEFRLLMASGVVDNAEQPDPPFVNCFNSFCDGEYFHKVVMGRTDAEIAVLEQMAKDFYWQRFGIDVDDPANIGRIIFDDFVSDPRMNYRNYVVGGKSTPADGWFFYDGGWFIVVTDPNGFTLGGEFSDVHVPQNTLFFFGNYHFIETTKNGKIRDRINVFYRSASPVVPVFDGAGGFRCELSLDGQDFPTGVQGQAQGFSGAIQISPTALKFNIRNVITFGPSAPLPGLGPDGITGDVPLVGADDDDDDDDDDDG